MKKLIVVTESLPFYKKLEEELRDTKRQIQMLQIPRYNTSKNLSSSDSVVVIGSDFDETYEKDAHRDFTFSKALILRESKQSIGDMVYSIRNHFRF